jgi:uncharacterized RDD family membrane protein YckC
MMSQEKSDQAPGTAREKKAPADQKTSGPARADVGRRIAAALVDGIPAYVISFIPYIGGLISAVYLAVRDGLPLNEGRGQSLGKKVFGLQALRLPDGKPCDYATSIQRNFPFAVPALIMMRPGMGWLFGSLVWGFIFIVEILLVIADEKGARIGDRIAGTTVVEV